MGRTICFAWVDNTMKVRGSIEEDGEVTGEWLATKGMDTFEA